MTFRYSFLPYWRLCWFRNAARLKKNNFLNARKTGERMLIPATWVIKQKRRGTRSRKSKTTGKSPSNKNANGSDRFLFHYTPLINKNCFLGLLTFVNTWCSRTTPIHMECNKCLDNHSCVMLELIKFIEYLRNQACLIMLSNLSRAQSQKVIRVPFLRPKHFTLWGIS